MANAPILNVSSQEARLRCRNDEHQVPTSGLAPGHIQANLIVLPSKYASDFRNLCARNPVPCPLIAESTHPGCFSSVKSTIPNLSGSQLLADGLDLRRDIPRYMVYKDSKLEKSHSKDITAEWTGDHIAFLIGCSYSFEAELVSEGLPPPHMVWGRNVAMYRTSIPLCPAGVFTGSTAVVSMRPYKRKDLGSVRSITRRYGVTHGEPIGWGWEALETLGIKNLDEPEWGDAPWTMGGEPLSKVRKAAGDLNSEDDEVPVFWACGVTPQEAVMRAGLEGVFMAHSPGYMLVLDARDEDIIQEVY